MIKYTQEIKDYMKDKIDKTYLHKNRWLLKFFNHIDISCEELIKIFPPMEILHHNNIDIMLIWKLLNNDDKRKIAYMPQFKGILESEGLIKNTEEEVIYEKWVLDNGAHLYERLKEI